MAAKDTLRGDAMNPGKGHRPLHLASGLFARIIPLLLILAACAPSAPPVKRVVLLAPFEGTYREIGYDALYPVRLALADKAVDGVELLSLDIGPDVDSAAAHASALAADSTVLLALVVGADAADAHVAAAFGDVPVIVVGHWNAVPDEGLFVLASADLPQMLTSREVDIHRAVLETGEVAGGETFGLKAFPLLADVMADVTVITNAAPPDADFTARLLESDLYVPAPGLLATVAYDAGTLAAEVLAVSATRADVLAALQGEGTPGINGPLRFDANGYWDGAPLHTYRYENGILAPVP